MIPFKAKTNSILTNTAVLLILLCISDSCFSYLQGFRRTREDSRRFTNDYHRQVAAQDQCRRSNTALQREAMELSPYVRDVRADSRQSRIDARDIRTDFREIRTELPNIRQNQRQARYARESRIGTEQRTPIVADRREQSRQIETVFRDLNNDLRSQGLSRNTREDTRDERNTRNIRDNYREYQNYSRQQSQRQLLERRNEDSPKERREHSQENRDRRGDNTGLRQIRDRRLERLSEDRLVVREDSRAIRNVRERFDDRRTTSRSNERSTERTSQVPREESRDLRNLPIRSDARRSMSAQDRSEVRRNARESRSDSSDDRASSRFDDRQFNQARREVREYSRRNTDDQERSFNQRSRAIALERQYNMRERHNDATSAQRRTSRQQQDDRERSGENREFSRQRQLSLNIRADSRRRVVPFNILQEQRNNNDLSKDSRIAGRRVEDSRQDDGRHIENTREWSRTLRVSSEPTRQREERRERQSAQRVFSRRIQDDRKEFIRHSEESRTRHISERRENSGSNSSQQAKTGNVGYILVAKRDRVDVRNSLRNIQKREDDSNRRVRIEGERRQIIPNSREGTRNIRDINSRRDLKDSRVMQMEALQNVEFIPSFKQKSDILSNTLQAVLIVALVGQIFFSTSKNRLRFASWTNLLGKEKVF